MMMEYRHLCVCSTTDHSTTPPNGVGQTGKDRLQKGFTVNSITVVLGTWKINKMRLNADRLRFLHEMTVLNCWIGITE